MKIKDLYEIFTITEEEKVALEAYDEVGHCTVITGWYKIPIIKKVYEYIDCYYYDGNLTEDQFIQQHKSELQEFLEDNLNTLIEDYEAGYSITISGV